MNELVRPTFNALEPPLRTVCGFIPYSRLFSEADSVRRYGDQPKPGFLNVSVTSDDFAQGQQAQADLAVASALSGLAARTAAEACALVAGIDPDLPGMPYAEGKRPLPARASSTRRCHRHS